VYPTADGSEVVIAGNADSVFARLCDAMGRPELAADPRYAAHGARGENMAELDEHISAWTRALTAEEVLARLEQHGVPAGRIFTARDMLADEHYRARDMVLRRLSAQGWEVPMTGVVPKFSRTPGGVRTTGPALGAHTVQVLTEVGGLTPAEVDALTEAGLL
jgi:crotonobetainyl-CoA:carnitine CoA-transferase CaiB-like acyl-CoA transferase